MGRLRLLTILLVFFLVVMVTPTSSGLDVNVIINLEYDNYIYEVKPNEIDELYINGSVTCTYDGFGSEVRYVKVDILVGDRQGWSKGGGPYSFVFYSNGTQDFVLQVTIPDETRNRTNNTVVVSGTWEIEPHTSLIFKTTGYATTDEINITILKRSFMNYSEEEPEDDDDFRFWVEQNIQFILLIIICTILTASLIVIGYFYVRKWLRKER